MATASRKTIVLELSESERAPKGFHAQFAGGRVWAVRNRYELVPCHGIDHRTAPKGLCCIVCGSRAISGYGANVPGFLPEIHIPDSVLAELDEEWEPTPAAAPASDAPRQLSLFEVGA